MHFKKKSTTLRFALLAVAFMVLAILVENVRSEAESEAESLRPIPLLKGPRFLKHKRPPLMRKRGPNGAPSFMRKQLRKKRPPPMKMAKNAAAVSSRRSAAHPSSQNSARRRADLINDMVRSIRENHGSQVKSISPSWNGRSPHEVIPVNSLPLQNEADNRLENRQSHPHQKHFNNHFRENRRQQPPPQRRGPPQPLRDLQNFQKDLQRGLNQRIQEPIRNLNKMMKEPMRDINKRLDDILRPQFRNSQGRHVPRPKRNKKPLPVKAEKAKFLNEDASGSSNKRPLGNEIEQPDYFTGANPSFPSGDSVEKGFKPFFKPSHKFENLSNKEIKMFKQHQEHQQHKNDFRGPQSVKKPENGFGKPPQQRNPGFAGKPHPKTRLNSSGPSKGNKRPFSRPRTTPRPIPTPGPMDFPPPPPRGPPPPPPTHAPLPDPITHPPEHYDSVTLSPPVEFADLYREFQKEQNVQQPKAQTGFNEYNQRQKQQQVDQQRPPFSFDGSGEQSPFDGFGGSDFSAGFGPPSHERKAERKRPDHEQKRTDFSDFGGFGNERKSVNNKKSERPDFSDFGGFGNERKSIKNKESEESFGFDGFRADQHQQHKRKSPSPYANKESMDFGGFHQADQHQHKQHKRKSSSPYASDKSVDFDFAGFGGMGKSEKKQHFGFSSGSPGKSFDDDTRRKRYVKKKSKKNKKTSTPSSEAEEGFFEMPSDFPSFDDFASGFESMKIRNKRSAMEGQNEDELMTAEQRLRLRRLNRANRRMALRNLLRNQARRRQMREQQENHTEHSVPESHDRRYGDDVESHLKQQFDNRRQDGFGTNGFRESFWEDVESDFGFFPQNQERQHQNQQRQKKPRYSDYYVEEEPSRPYYDDAFDTEEFSYRPRNRYNEGRPRFHNQHQQQHYQNQEINGRPNRPYLRRRDRNNYENRPTKYANEYEEFGQRYDIVKKNKPDVLAQKLNRYDIVPKKPLIEVPDFEVEQAPSEKDNEILGSGNFAVIKGGTFFDKDSYLYSAYNAPRQILGRNENHLERFRDFADIKNDVYRKQQLRRRFY